MPVIYNTIETPPKTLALVKISFSRLQPWLNMVITLADFATGFVFQYIKYKGIYTSIKKKDYLAVGWGANSNTRCHKEGEGYHIRQLQTTKTSTSMLVFGFNVSKLNEKTRD